MPKLWDETIEAHRRAVRDATLDAAAALAAERGPTSVTMSQIAARTGIGRATLYKYFPDVEAIMTAWHQRQIAQHLVELTQVRDRVHGAVPRLEAVLEAFARNLHQQDGSRLAALLHRGEHVARAEQQLYGLVQDLIREGARAGAVRDDVASDELAAYCLHAITAAGALTSDAAVHRLVGVILAGLLAGPTIRAPGTTGSQP